MGKIKSKSNWLKYVSASALTLTIMGIGYSVGHQVYASENLPSLANKLSNASMQDTGDHTKQSRDTGYDAEDLIKDGTITVNSVTWAYPDDTTYDYQSGNKPTGYSITINKNSKLKSGDSIYMYMPTGGRYWAGPTMASAKRTLPGVGRVDGMKVVLDDTYDSSTDVDIKTSNLKAQGYYIINPTAPADSASATYLGQTKNYKLNLHTPKTDGDYARKFFRNGGSETGGDVTGPLWETVLGFPQGSEGNGRK